MFEDIAQMEKEIEAFRKNIVASSELVDGITDLTEAVKQQKDSFAASSDALIEKLDACVLQFKADHDTSIYKLESSNTAAIEQMRQSISTDMQDWLSQLEKVKTAIESCETATTQKTDEQIRQLSAEGERIISEMQTSLASQVSAYLEKLQQTEEAISKYQFEAESKYNSFVQQLESTNVDQIFKEVQDLKKSIQIKFAILMAGVGATIIAAILSIVIN